MKRLILILTLALVMEALNAQTIKLFDSSAMKNKHQIYLKRYKTYKTVGGVMASAGLVMLVIGVAQPSPHYYINSNPALGFPKRAGSGFRIAGGVIGLGSIPFFVIAHDYKRKTSIALKNETLPLIYGASNYNLNYPAISFKLTL